MRSIPTFGKMESKNHCNHPCTVVKEYGDDLFMRKDQCHLTLAEPPEILFCTVKESSFDKVFKQGLNRKEKAFIWMYETADEARRNRDNKKAYFLFAIIAHVMYEDGYQFSHADTGEWLTDEIPSRYIRLI